MTNLRFSEVASLLRVSDDTVRRWVDQGRLTALQPDVGRMVIPGSEVAKFVRERRDQDGPADTHSSARNRLDGIVTNVQREGLIALVEIQAGPFRVVSMMTREAADELGLEPGSLATAVVKATTVLVETPSSDRS
ncbi:TOBE domain-containing protein [Cryobacterium cryoconiti]|uniref:Helix-turn-helix domain-containing protein n=1 Tax=Cryobacterium cryoconiti TaxID=1259239 RepID=A0A4Y8JYL3_9MICO|nr:TOBE domain-containing protein [Cryobacterium cryoconiti]TFD33229.1 helix-turn-helix domain-containing protein [Cryobacterium cryoconiti]